MVNLSLRFRTSIHPSLTLGKLTTTLTQLLGCLLLIVYISLISKYESYVNRGRMRGLSRTDTEQSRQRCAESEQNFLRALAEREGRDPLVTLFGDVALTKKWSPDDRNGIDAWGKPRSREHASIIGARGNVPFQIKSSWGGVDAFICEKDERSECRGIGSPGDRIIVINAQRSYRDIQVQCATSILHYAGLELDPSNPEVMDVLEYCFHRTIVEAAVRKMGGAPRAGRVYERVLRDPVLENRVVVVPKGKLGNIFHNSNKKRR